VAQAEHRVLMLESSGLCGKSAITPLVHAGLQLILPGRRTEATVYCVVEGRGQENKPGRCGL
jgi:gentisate 1,2-dioxygenase